jgi:hypothetical protein
MTDAVMENFSFGHGFVQAADKVRVVARLDDLADTGSQASMLMMWAGEERGWRHFDLAWAVVRIACSRSAMFALGADGRVMVADKSGVREERIDGPEARGELRDLCLVEGRPHVVGAGGQVYRRAGPEAWEPLEDGLPSGGDAPDFNAVDGGGAGVIHAAGEGGEIWSLADGTWRRISSPTEGSLHALRVVEPELALAVGQGGILLLGRGDRWESASGGPAPEDLWGVERFGGRVFAAGLSRLYALGDDDRLEPVSVVDGPGWTYRHLHAAGGVMWSFGERHLFKTKDGESFDLVRAPFESVDPTEVGPGAGGSCGCGDGSHHHHG